MKWIKLDGSLRPQISPEGNFALNGGTSGCAASTSPVGVLWQRRPKNRILCTQREPAWVGVSVRFFLIFFSGAADPLRPLPASHSRRTSWQWVGDGLWGGGERATAAALQLEAGIVNGSGSPCWYVVAVSRQSVHSFCVGHRRRFRVKFPAILAAEMPQRAREFWAKCLWAEWSHHPERHESEKKFLVFMSCEERRAGRRLWTAARNSKFFKDFRGKKKIGKKFACGPVRVHRRHRRRPKCADLRLTSVSARPETAARPPRRRWRPPPTNSRIWNKRPPCLIHGIIIIWGTTRRWRWDDSPLN